MTLAKGDLIGKLNKETGEAISPEGSSYVHFEVAELTGSFYLTIQGDPPVPDDGVTPEVTSHDPYQLVLLRKVR